jgi:membrane protease YdiL (CAAX protease family)
MLWLLNYVVLDYDLQFGAAGMLFDLLHRLGLESPPPRNLLMKVTWSLGCLTVYFIIPGLFTRFVLKKPLSYLGISPAGFLKHFGLYLLLFLPVAASVVVVSYRAEFQATYPFYHNPASLWHLVAWDLFYAVQFFGLEFFFRGFMLAGWKERIGWRAVLFMIIPYCMIHFPKPSLEALGAIVAGSVLGILALRTRSIWGGVCIHVAVAWSMDVASLWQRGWFR